MSDFSEVLTKSFKEVFDVRQGKCFYHLKANIIKRYSKKKFSHFEEYIEELGSCLSCQELDFVWELIKKDIPKKKMNLKK